MPVDYILQYWNKIQSGEIVVSKRIKQLYQKVIDELENPKEPYIFDIELATKPITFIETFCKNSKGKWAGKPIELLLWQKTMIQVIYGFVNKNTKQRRAREIFIICGRKNGKSVLTSGLGLFGMIEEQGAEVACVSTKMDAAKIVFNEALNMVKQSPYLNKHIRKRKSDLYLDETFSSFKPLSSKSNTLDGLNTSLGIADEIGAIRDRDIYDVILQSQSARQQPMMFSISTAGFVREGLFDAQYKYGCQVLDGVVQNDSFLPFFYELDDKSEIDDPGMWIKANPSLGVTKSFEDLKSNIEKARVDSTFMPTVLVKDFNVRETVAGSWLTFEELNSEDTFNLADFKNSYAIAGVDLSETNDLTCATLLMMHDGNDIKYIYQHYFIPEDTAGKKIKEDKVPYDVWQKQGLITYCKGVKIDYSDVTAWFEKVMKEYKIIPYWIYYDRWNTQYWFKEMASKGFQMRTCGQGFKDVSPAMKVMTVDFQSHLMNYNNNPITKWCLSNTAITADAAGNIKFDKGKNRKQRIDGTASLYDAFFGLQANFLDYKQLIRGR